MAGQLRVLLADRPDVARIIFGEQGEGGEDECETVGAVGVYEVSENHQECRAGRGST